ncbi:hypothetical protein [Pelagibacterium limicola]|uniref:hypothetical protein n=1 Tax=Pelagibacterium limicola TaxID=2791022 RepID=UPI0018B010D4|nr:hypothetical protein [Pelagibacterium limicola]
MADNKNISTYFDSGAVTRKPSDIAADPMLSNARKIELLKSYKDHHAAPEHKGVLRDADLELEKLLKLNSLANER